MDSGEQVVTSDGRTVTVGYWLSENIERRKKAEARVAELEAVATAMLDQFTEYVDERHAYMRSREVGATVVNAWRAALSGDGS